MIVIYHSDIPISSSIFNIGNTLSHIATASISVNNTEICKKRSARGFIEMVNEEGLSDCVNSLDNGICIIRLKKKSGRIQHEVSHEHNYLVAVLPHMVINSWQLTVHETNTYQLDELTGTFNISLVHELKVQDESTEVFNQSIVILLTICIHLYQKLTITSLIRHN